MLDTVLGVLRSCSPILASYIDEHCDIFVNVSGGGGGDPGVLQMERETFNDFRRTVDALLTDLLAEVGIGLEDVARTLQLAREQPDDADRAAGGLVEHLLAVESFASFRRLMTARSYCASVWVSVIQPGCQTGKAAASSPR